MGRPKGSKNRPKYDDNEPKQKKPRKPTERHEGSNPIGHQKGVPYKTEEQKAEDKALLEEVRNRRMKELTNERKAQLGAEIMAKEQTEIELETMSKEVRAVRARWKIDKEKLQTHNQYITAIATLPNINYDDPEQARERVQMYIDIATAAGQRVVFETCALALGMSRQMLYARLNGQVKLSEEQRRVWRWAKALLDSAMAEYAHSGESNAIATIFLARNNQGYTNADPVNIESGSDTAAEQTNEEIARKYGDLPE